MQDQHFRQTNFSYASLALWLASLLHFSISFSSLNQIISSRINRFCRLTHQLLTRQILEMKMLVIKSPLIAVNVDKQSNSVCEFSIDDSQSHYYLPSASQSDSKMPMSKCHEATTMAGLLTGSNQALWMDFKCFSVILCVCLRQNFCPKMCRLTSTRTRRVASKTHTNFPHQTWLNT